MSQKEKKDHLKKISHLTQTAVDEETELPMDEETALLGNFNESGLPEMFKASWRNAEVILKEDGVGQAPGSKTNKVVMSTTSGSLHLVRVTDEKVPCCDCEGFKHKALCSLLPHQYPSRWAPYKEYFLVGHQTSPANYKRVCQVEQALKKTKRAGKEPEKRTQRNDPPQGFLIEFHQ